MQLTCQQCLTKYNLDAALLGEDGRDVRCTQCQYTWFCAQPEKPPVAKPAATAAAAPPPPPPPPPPVATIAAPVTAKPVAPMEAKPIPRDMPQAAAIYTPMGMGAAQFGLLTFVLLVSLTLIPAFLGKKMIANAFPAMTYLYKKIGIDIPAPGEGLRLFDMAAEARVDGEKKTLTIEASLSNTTPHMMPAPLVEVTLKGLHDAPLKTWTFRPKSSKIASGAVEPVKLEFQDIPDDGRTVSLTVINE